MAKNELFGDIKMPALGYGTWQAKGDELETALEAALEAGYRHIDTAYLYENEAIIGKVLKRWFSSGKLKREDLFIVSKLPPQGNRPEGVRKYIRRSLEALDVGYLDVYLIHSPIGFNDVETSPPFFKEDGTLNLDMNTDHVAIWKEMEKLVDAGLTKAIGVSNFNTRQIQRIIDNSRIPPANLQVELHVYLQQRELVEFCRRNNVLVTAYAPFGSPGRTAAMENPSKKLAYILHDPVVQAVAKKHKKTAAQVLLRHLIQKGIAVIPKSVTPERIRENIEVFDFALDDGDVGKLDDLDRGENGRMFDFSSFDGLDKHPEHPMK